MDSFEDLEFTEVEVPATLAVQVEGKCAIDPASIGAAMGTAFGTLCAFIGKHHLTPTGQPRAIYTGYGPEGTSFIALMPVAAAPEGADGADGATVGTIEGKKAYRFTHRGPYPELAATYGRITEFMKAKGWIETEADWSRYMPMWEEYLNDPETTTPADLRTYIYLPAV